MVVEEVGIHALSIIHLLVIHHLLGLYTADLISLGLMRAGCKKWVLLVRHYNAILSRGGCCLFELFSRLRGFIARQDEVLIQLHLLIFIDIRSEVAFSSVSCQFLLLKHAFSVEHDIFSSVDSLGPVLTGSVCHGIRSNLGLSWWCSCRLAVHTCGWGWLLSSLQISQFLLVHGSRARRA